MNGAPTLISDITGRGGNQHGRQWSLSYPCQTLGQTHLRVFLAPSWLPNLVCYLSSTSGYVLTAQASRRSVRGRYQTDRNAQLKSIYLQTPARHVKTSM